MRQALKIKSIGQFLYGNLKDSDRIFTNVYQDGDAYINGALKRVQRCIFREIGIGLRILLPMVQIGLLIKLKHQG